MNADLLNQARDQLTEMRTRLTNSIRELDRTLAETIQSRGELSHLPTHNADHDTEGTDAEITLGQNEEYLLEAVKAALERLHEGTYGECLMCGRAIATERLEAIPYAPTCMECERRREKLQARGA
jgi:RNA polymerase-binding protein DksA